MKWEEIIEDELISKKSYNYFGEYPRTISLLKYNSFLSLFKKYQFVDCVGNGKVKISAKKGKILIERIKED